MTSQAVIRPYEPRDRQAVRQICCDTADRGEPMESFFSDREVLADLVTRYYTDCELLSSWVAERDGEVVGYLTGCLDTRRFLRVMAWRIVPVTFLKALARGTLWHPQTVTLIGASVSGWLRGGFRRGVSVGNYPAHLHINLRKECRGQQIGLRLMERFLEQARQAGVNGVQASVSSENAPAHRFFEGLGFTALARKARLQSSDDRDIFTVVYGKRL